METKFIQFFLFQFIFLLTTYAQKNIPVANSTNQKDYFGPIRVIVKLDPLTRLPIGNVPFDRTFILRVYFDPNSGQDNRDIDVKGFYLVYENGKTIPLSYYLITSITKVGSTDTKITDYDQADNFLKIYPNAIDVVIPALEPNRNYIIFYSTSAIRYLLPYIDALQLFYKGYFKEGRNLVQEFKKNNDNDPSIVTGHSLEKYYKDHQSKIDSIFKNNLIDNTKRNTELIEYLESNSSASLLIEGKYQTVTDLFGEIKDLGKLNTHKYVLKDNTALRIVGDGGVIYAGWQKDFNVVSSYLGVNISFRPMDTDIPFRYLVRNNRIKFYHRFTANLGLSLNSIAKENYRANLFSNNNVMVGLGFKVNHVINLNFGGLIYFNVDPNPLISNKTIGLAPYAGVSFNLLIKDAFGDIAKIFDYGK